MLEKQINALRTVVSSNDLHQYYTGDNFCNLVQAVVFSDPVAGVSVIRSAKDIFLHLPSALFWDKMQRFLLGTFRNYEEQVNMAAKFNNDNDRYNQYLKRLVHLINQIDDDNKIYFFSSLTRAFLLTDLEQSLFFKLSKYIEFCTLEELEFLRDVPLDYSSNNTAMISSLYQYGLLMQDTSDSSRYVLSDFGKALKQNCLNFNDGVKGESRLDSYSSLSPINIASPIFGGALTQVNTYHIS